MIHLTFQKDLCGYRFLGKSELIVLIFKIILWVLIWETIEQTVGSVDFLVELRVGFPKVEGSGSDRDASAR